jgi:hypothetical protein
LRCRGDASNWISPRYISTPFIRLGQQLKRDPALTNEPPEVWANDCPLGPPSEWPKGSGKFHDVDHTGGWSIFFNLPHCFNPRHGLRIMHAGSITDFLICFECQQVQVWSGGQQISRWSTDSSPQPVFDHCDSKA